MACRSAVGWWLLGRSNPEQLVEDSSVVSQATGAITFAVRGVGGLLVILFVGIYVAAQPGMYHRGARRLVPVQWRGRFDQVLHEIVGVLRWWLVGKLLSMALVGVLTTIGLWLLAVLLALTFGLLAAVLTFVPNFGPVLSVVPPALLALADDPGRAAYVVVLYLAIQTVGAMPSRLSFSGGPSRWRRRSRLPHRSCSACWSAPSALPSRRR